MNVTISSSSWQKKCYWYLAASLFLIEFAVKVSPGYLGSWILYDFSLNYSQIGLYSALFYVTYALSQVPSGLLLTRFKIKNLFLLYLLLFSLGVLITAHTKSYTFLCAARIFMGIGSSLTFTTLLTLAHNWFEEKDFSYYVGITNLFGMLGPVFLGKICQTSLAQENWQNLFLSLGSGLLIFFILFFLLPVENIVQKSSLTSRQIFKNIFKTKSFWSSLLIATTLVCSVTLIPELWGAFYLQYHHHLDPQSTSSLIALIYAGIAIGGPTFGLLSRQFSTHQLIRFSLFSQSLLLFLFTQQSVTFLQPILFFIGFFASSMLLTFTIIKKIFKYAVPIALSSFNMLLTLFASSTQPLSGWLFDLNEKLSFSTGMTFLLLFGSVLHFLLGFFSKKLLFFHQE